MAEGQKRRWAAINAAEAAPVAPKMLETLAAIIAPPEDAEFKRAMSATMKASWAKRKKATAAIAAKPTAVTAKAPLPVAPLVALLYKRPALQWRRQAARMRFLFPSRL
jgi:hypothetical protein